MGRTYAKMSSYERRTLQQTRKFLKSKRLSFYETTNEKFKRIMNTIKEGEIHIFFELPSSELTKIETTFVKTSELNTLAISAYVKEEYDTSELKNDFTIITKKYDTIKALVIETNGFFHDNNPSSEEKLHKQALRDYLKEKITIEAGYNFYALKMGPKTTDENIYNKIKHTLKEFLGIYA